MVRRVMPMASAVRATIRCVHESVCSLKTIDRHVDWGSGWHCVPAADDERGRSSTQGSEP